MLLYALCIAHIYNCRNGCHIWIPHLSEKRCGLRRTSCWDHSNPGWKWVVESSKIHTTLCFPSIKGGTGLLTQCTRRLKGRNESHTQVHKAITVLCNSCQTMCREKFAESFSFHFVSFHSRLGSVLPIIVLRYCCSLALFSIQNLA